MHTIDISNDPGFFINPVNINLENKKGYYKKKKGVELNAWN